MKKVFTALARHGAERPLEIAFREPDRSITWAALAREVGAQAAGLREAPAVLGIGFSGIDYVISDLAATLAGRRVVPVPSFFATAQVQHLLRDAKAEMLDRLPDPAAYPLPLDYAGGADRVIYTSGTTGQPKGVVLGDRQLEASIAGLAAALRPGSGDRYLSVLPQAQLLEQVCGIFLPILAGAETLICPEGLAALMGGDGAGLARAAEEFGPTITVLAPRQLALWVAALRQGWAKPPSSLRYVAVGGAPTSPALLAEARGLGLPVAEGYGLSEACSVVALTPSNAGSMRVIEGVSVRIDAGEIVISGPTVMQGYLHSDAVQGEWRTGDLGEIENGALRVLGRRDAMILRQSGRNIAPEWIEAAALADPLVPFAALVQVAGDRLVLVLAPAAAPDMQGLVTRLSALPFYARPEHVLMVDARLPGLIRPSGQMDRTHARELAAKREAEWISLRESPDERRLA
ncbi:AMP-binding protein [Paracoccus sp. MBLB3053]|uniref:AMP-binding protein n=1 Tax=Paracoccus aurantius TaxID=3073814 RepID=A0ABU2HUP4_9RHOB|nr:AMP-binding protein [Paracoccus sp. MBLB3053]MDS9468775.1 AMP-binding protein [Paracoccus sp. MBLB3053]